MMSSDLPPRILILHIEGRNNPGFPKPNMETVDVGATLALYTLHYFGNVLVPKANNAILANQLYIRFTADLLFFLNVNDLHAKMPSRACFYKVLAQYLDEQLESDKFLDNAAKGCIPFVKNTVHGKMVINADFDFDALELDLEPVPFGYVQHLIQTGSLPTTFVKANRGSTFAENMALIYGKRAPRSMYLDLRDD